MKESDLIGVGGRLWERGSMRRVYFNDVGRFIGLDVTRYSTGNIQSATLNGEHISNTKARKMLDSLGKVYFDLVKGEWSHAEIGEAIEREVANG